jgi:hypothetical protein
MEKKMFCNNYLTWLYTKKESWCITNIPCLWLPIDGEAVTDDVIAVYSERSRK